MQNIVLTNFELYDSRHIPTRPSEEILSFVNDSAYRLVRAQEENMVLKPWVLLAFVLLQKQAAEDKQGTALDELTEQAVWLRDLSRHYGAFLHWPGTVRAQLSVLAIMKTLCTKVRGLMTGQIEQS